MAACAVGLHCLRYKHLNAQLGRQLTDMDFVSYEKYMPVMERFFEEIGYEPRRYFSYHWGRESYKPIPRDPDM